MSSRKNNTEFLDKVHLQWFAEEDDEEGDDQQQMSEEELNYYKKFQARKYGPTDKEDVEVLVEGIDEIPEDDTKESEEESGTNDPASSMMKFFEQMQEKDSKRDEQINSGFKELAEAFKSSQQGGEQKQQGPSWQDMQERFNSNFYENPAQSFAEMMEFWAQQRLAPAFQHQQQALSKTQKEITKQQAKEDPTKKYVVDNYWEEVEELAGKQGGSGDAYNEAINRVAANHLTEIMSEMMKNEQTKPASNKQPKLSGGKQPLKQKKQKRLKLTQRGKALADARGVDYTDAARSWRGNTNLVEEV